MHTARLLALVIGLGTLSACTPPGDDSSAVGPPEEPPTLVLEASMLAISKARVQAGQADVAIPLDTLRALAEAQMAQPIVSVMDKRIEPPSGDMHDYLSRAPYFWPNPDTPDGLPYVKRDGVVYEENRSGTDFLARAQMENTVLVLGLAYYLTEDERYAEHAVRQLRTWFLDPATRMNPHLRHAQGVPGIMDGSEWGTIENWRLPVLLDAVRLLSASPAWTAADQAGLEAWMADYLTYLETEELGQMAGLMWNNHGSFYDAQRAAIALFIDRPEHARAILREAWHRRINHGIEGDGWQPYELERTRPFGYSLFQLRSYFVLAALAAHLDLDLWNHTASDGSGIRTALDRLAVYADPDVPWPHEDLAFDRQLLIPILRWAAFAYDHPEYAVQARGIPGYDEAVRRMPLNNVDLHQLFLAP